MRESVREYKIEKLADSAYIPVLDRDPEFAARFLLKKEVPKCYEILKDMYNGMKKGEVRRLILYETVMDSKDNFLWYVAFFKELEKILKIEEDYRVPMEVCPENSGEAPKVYQPFRVLKRPYARKEGGIRYADVCNLPTNAKNQDPINNYRIAYIVADYDMSEFQDDVYPAWYLLKNTTILEQYNEKTNTRVRIDFRNGGFIYFLAGASDNWQMIPDVPREMDHIISALIFRHFD